MMMQTTDDNKKRVQFESIEVREYPMIIGDHPSCSHGVPVQLDWNHEKTYSCELQLYEYCRTERRQTRKELLIPFQERARILIDAGYTLDEIGGATLSVIKVKKEREESLRKSKKWDRSSTLIEKTGKLPLSIMSGFTALIIKPVQKSVHARTA